MKKIRYILAVILVLVMVLSLCACGTKEPTSNNSVDVSDSSSKVEFKETTITLDGCEIIVLGAEKIVDTDEKDALRIWYDITNTSDSSNNVSWMFELSVVQDSVELEETSADLELAVDEERNSVRQIRPGVKIRAIYEATLSGDKPVDVKFIDAYDETVFTTITFDPNNLPGAPTQPFTPEKVTNPSWMGDVKSEGTYTSFGETYEIKIDKFEKIEGVGSIEAMRVYFEFKNTSSEKTAFGHVATPVAYQDGIELDIAFPVEEIEEDENYMLEIEPDESIVVTACYEIMSDSPVEIDLLDMDGTGVGTVFDI